jgi:hypothetical protein
MREVSRVRPREYQKPVAVSTARFPSDLAIGSKWWTMPGRRLWLFRFVLRLEFVASDKKAEGSEQDECTFHLPSSNVGSTSRQGRTSIFFSGPRYKQAPGGPDSPIGRPMADSPTGGLPLQFLTPSVCL